MSLSKVYCIQKMILSIEIILTGKSEKTQSDRGQFMTNQPMVVIKICLYFAFLSVYLLCLPSNICFLPLLFQRKRTADIYIFSCMLYLSCSVRGKSIKNI